MRLDLILYRPEFFIVFGFFVLLWAGTGSLVSPVAEVLTITSIYKNTKNNSIFITHNHAHPMGARRVKRISNPVATIGESRAGGLETVSSNRGLKGPNIVSMPLTLWAIAWCILSFCCVYFLPLHYVFLGGSFQKDAYTTGARRILFFTRSLVFRVSLSWQKIAGICQSEYIYLALLAATGGYLLIIATDLIAMYLCIELQSFSLVVLCGLNSKNAFSLEAAIKYFLLSAFRSCFTLLGIGFVYWEIGETSLPHIERLCKRTRNRPTLSTALGIWLISIGLLWKLAVAPLHFWVPDVYMGAWSSVSLWITLIPKIAVLRFWTAHWISLWGTFFAEYLSLFRAFSLIVGAIAPLAQKDIKRLLSYSSIGHIGLLLIPLCINREESIGVLWVYILLYIFINLGAWGLLFWPIYRPLFLFGARDLFKKEDKMYRSQRQNHGENRLFRRVAPMPQYLWDLKGLNTSLSRAAFRWAVFIRSFAGLPPAYSFLGKRRILWQRINYGLYILVFVALGYTIVRSVYYLKVIKICYVDKNPTYRSYGKVSSLTAYIIAFCAFVMLIGLWHGNFLFLVTHLLALKRYLLIFNFYLERSINFLNTNFYIVFLVSFRDCITKKKGYSLNAKSSFLYFVVPFLFLLMNSSLFLFTSVVLFGMGAIGTFLNRRSFLIMLLCIEVMLLSANLLFLTGSVTVDDLNGQLMALWVLTAAAAETALGLALCVLYFRLRKTLDVELISLIKG